VDFTSIDNASAALINPKNHHLNGRDLKVEFASPDAVRRGGGAIPRKRRPLSAGYKKTRGRKKKDEGDAAQVAGSDEKPASATQGYDDPHSGKSTKEKMRKERPRSISTGTLVDRGKAKSRPKPGAALAQAKRETAAIVPSQGKKIIF
jgi:RNA recognition motif-containing protein